jgi:hypothetical protein
LSQWRNFKRKKYFEINNNKTTTEQNLWNKAKTVLSRKLEHFVHTLAMKNDSNLVYNLKQLENEIKLNPK